MRRCEFSHDNQEFGFCEDPDLDAFRQRANLESSICPTWLLGWMVADSPCQILASEIFTAMVHQKGD